MSNQQSRIVKAREVAKGILLAVVVLAVIWGVLLGVFALTTSTSSRSGTGAEHITKQVPGVHAPPPTVR